MRGGVGQRDIQLSIYLYNCPIPKPMYAIGRHMHVHHVQTKEKRLVQNIPGALGTKYMHRKMVMTTPPAAPDTKF